MPEIKSIKTQPFLKSKINGGHQYRPFGPEIRESHVGQRLDFYLSQTYRFLSRSQWQKRLMAGKVLVNGEAVKPSYKTRAGDSLGLFHPHEREPSVDTGIFPIWKKGNVMVMQKTAPLPMHEVGAYRFNTFSYLLNREFGDGWAAVHRLDMETSGIVLCGRSHQVRVKLAQNLADRRVEKVYLAIARGNAHHDRWVEKGPIGNLATSRIRIKKWVVPGGLPCQTLFEVVDRINGFTLLKAYPKTGRTNQIRIHSSVSGLPLVGDKLYAPDENIFLEYFAHGNTETVIRSVLHPRVCLHAHRIIFEHPEDGSRCIVESDMPNDMEQFWQKLKFERCGDPDYQPSNPSVF